MFVRSLQIESRSGSYFLFGPRQTGKSTWLKSILTEVLIINLLKPKMARELQENPELLEDLIRQFALSREPAPKKEILTIVIDEVQKVPELLDVIQDILLNGVSLASSVKGPNSSRMHMECRFILSGSSPRKLLASQRNLLGGRAGWQSFHPLTVQELLSDPEYHFSQKEMIQWGGMPAPAKLKSKKSWFENYIEVFLETEIRNEALVRNIPAFERFLRIAANGVSEQTVFRAIASDLGITEKTVASWYQILVDTLVGELLPCFDLTTKRKPVSAPKFYFFDCGITNALMGRWDLVEGSREMAVAMESWVYQNLKALCAYSKKRYRLFYWRTTDKTEVDFIISLEDTAVWAIEVKCTAHPKEAHFEGLRRFREEFPKTKCALVCNVATSSRKEDGILASHFLECFKVLSLDIMDPSTDE